MPTSYTLFSCPVKLSLLYDCLVPVDTTTQSGAFGTLLQKDVLLDTGSMCYRVFSWLTLDLQMIFVFTGDHLCEVSAEMYGPGPTSC